MELIRQNKLLFFVALLATLVFGSFIYFSLFRSSSLPKQQTPVVIYSPTPSSPQTPIVPLDANTPISGQSYQILSPDYNEQIDREIKVNQLIDKLPVNEANFSLTYSFNDYTFTLTLKKGFEAQGNSDFDQLLKDNQIDNRTWLGKMVINSQ